MPKTKVRLWTAADVEKYADSATAAGHPSIAAIIRLQWEIGSG